MVLQACRLRRLQSNVKRPRAYTAGLFCAQERSLVQIMLLARGVDEMDAVMGAVFIRYMSLACASAG